MVAEHVDFASVGRYAAHARAYTLLNHSVRWDFRILVRQELCCESGQTILAVTKRFFSSVRGLSYEFLRAAGEGFPPLPPVFRIRKGSRGCRIPTAHTDRSSALASLH